jgi:hypothetical protein
MPTACLRLIPNAKIPTWLAATNQGGDTDGLGVSVDAYTIADTARPRIATHKYGSSVPNVDQLTFLQGAGTDPVTGYVDLVATDPNLAGCVAKLWTIPGASPLAAILAAEGLTSNPNFEPA